MDDYQEAGQFLSDSLQPAGWLPALFKQVYSKKHLHFQHNDTKIRWYYSGLGGGRRRSADTGSTGKGACFHFSQVGIEFFPMVELNLSEIHQKNVM